MLKKINKISPKSEFVPIGKYNQLVDVINLLIVKFNFLEIVEDVVKEVKQLPEKNKSMDTNKVPVKKNKTKKI